MSRHKTDSNDVHRARGNGRRIFWIAAVFVALLLTWRVAAGSAHDRWGAGTRHHTEESWSEHDIARAFDYLDLDAQRRPAVVAAVVELRDELESARVDQSRLTESLEALLAADRLDRAALDALRIEAADLGSRFATDSFDAVVDVATGLDSQQRRELIAAWRAHR